MSIIHGRIYPVAVYVNHVSNEHSPMRFSNPEGVVLENMGELSRWEVFYPPPSDPHYYGSYQSQAKNG